MTLANGAAAILVAVLLYRAYTRWALTMVLALTQVALAIGVVYPTAKAIDHGLYSRLSPAAAALVPVLMAGAFAAGFEGFGGLLDRYLDDGPVKGSLTPYKWAGLALAFVFATTWLNRSFGVSPIRTSLVAFGLFYGTVTLLRPAWFWDHPKAAALRAHVGDQATRTIYLVLSIASVAYGLFGPLPV